MKHIFLYIALSLITLTGCLKNETVILEATGIVSDLSGQDNCRFIIELDNGKCIQPLYYPENFIFIEGQRIFIEYKEIPDIISTCDQGVAADIIYIEELGCSPYIDLYTNNYDSLASDPLYINEAFIEENFLKISISYSGGCRNHIINLTRIHNENNSHEDIPQFEIRHNSNGDMCEAFITKNICFDITDLINEGVEEFSVFADQEGEENYFMIFKID